MRIESLTYLAWLIPFAAPILIGQWLAFPGFLLRTANRWLPQSLLLAAYFSACDAVGIATGIWSIGESTTTGIRLLGILPIEEALFFVLSTLMVSQSMTLMLWRLGDVPGEPWVGWRNALGSGVVRADRSAGYPSSTRA